MTRTHKKKPKQQRREAWLYDGGRNLVRRVRIVRVHVINRERFYQIEFVPPQQGHTFSIMDEESLHDSFDAARLYGLKQLEWQCGLFSAKLTVLQQLADELRKQEQPQ